MDDDEIINVPVPRRHLALIIQTLATAMTGHNATVSVTSTGGTSSAPVVTRSDTQDPQNSKRVIWNADNLKILRRGLKSDTPITMLTMASERPNYKVYFEEVSHNLAQADSATRARMGTMTKVIKREFQVNYEDANWPVEVEWDKDNGKMYYVMNEETAKAWKDSVI